MTANTSTWLLFLSSAYLIKAEEEELHNEFTSRRYSGWTSIDSLSSDSERTVWRAQRSLVFLGEYYDDLSKRVSSYFKLLLRKRSHLWPYLSENKHFPATSHFTFYGHLWFWFLRVRVRRHWRYTSVSIHTNSSASSSGLSIFLKHRVKISVIILDEALKWRLHQSARRLPSWFQSLVVTWSFWRIFKTELTWTGTQTTCAEWVSCPEVTFASLGGLS